MNKKLIFLVVSFLYIVTATAQPLLIPYPRSIEMREGYFALTAKTGIINLSDKNNARLLKHYIEEDININLHEQRGDNNIFLITNRKLKESLGAEGYRMNISTDSIVIEGAENAGVFYGIQTLRQLAAQNTRDPRLYENVACPGDKTDWPYPVWKYSTNQNTNGETLCSTKHAISKGKSS